MPSREDVNHQLALLGTYRRNLQQLLKQLGLQGRNQASLGTQNSILESRENIRRIKIVLQNWGVDVEDHPDDTEPVYAEPETTAIPAGTRIGIEFENNTKILVMPNAVFAVFKMAMQRDYGVDISEFVVAQ